MGGIFSFSIASKIESCEVIDECQCQKSPKKSKERKSTPKKDKPENIVLKNTC